MKDLTLWHLLRSRALDSPELPALLTELADLPMQARFPFFGLLEPALAHPSAALRAAAVRALHGAEGYLAARVLTGVLDDRDEDVRAAAIDAMRESFESEPLRWAHVLFHGDATVRLRALEGGSPDGARELEIYLFADPACAPFLTHRLDLPVSQASEEPDKRPLRTPSIAITAVLELVERGILTRGRARCLAAPMSIASLSSIVRWRRRTDDQVAAILDAVVEPTDAARAAALAIDDADALFRLFGVSDREAASDPELTSEKSTLDQFFGDMEKLLAQPHHHALHPRIAASILAIALTGGAITPRVARLCALCHPEIVAYRWLDVDVRRAAAHVFHDLGSAVSKLKRLDSEVQALLYSDACLRGDRPDLGVVGALLELVQGDPYARAVEWIGADTIAGAVAADVRRAARFFSLQSGGDSPAHAHLIDRLQALVPGKRERLYAVLVIASPATEMSFLEPLDSRASLEVLAWVLVLATSRHARLTDAKTTRLAEMLGRRIGAEHAGEFLRAWLRRRQPEAIALGLRTLGVVAQEIPAETFVGLATALPRPLLRKLLRALPYAAAFPYAKEAMLARVLDGDADADVAEWARERIPPDHGPPSPERGAQEIVFEIPPAVARTIAIASEADLAKALVPCLRDPLRGVAAALAARHEPTEPSLEACLALLGAHDPRPDVAAQFERFGSTQPRFLSDLDAAAVRGWERTMTLPILGHAWLYRWERHAFAAVEALVREGEGDLAATMERAAVLESELLSVHVFEAVSCALAKWRWRDAVRVIDLATPRLVNLLVEQLDTPLGPACAEALVAIHDAALQVDRVAARGGAEVYPVGSGRLLQLLEETRARIVALLPDLDDRTRDNLGSWIEASGLASRAAPMRTARVVIEAEDVPLSVIAASRDLDLLEALCRSRRVATAHTAAVRLIELGEDGLARLVRALRSNDEVPSFAALVDSLSLWPEGAALAEARALTRDPAVRASSRFHVALALVERGDRDLLAAALDAAAEDRPEPWFRPADYQRLVRVAGDETRVAIALAISPHAHAYRPSVERLLALVTGERAAPDPEPIAQALRAFLDCGTRRMGELRRRAAHALLESSDPHGFPIALADSQREYKAALNPLLRAPAELVEVTVAAGLLAGSSTISERRLLDMITPPSIDGDARNRAYERLLEGGRDDGVRQAVAARASTSAARSGKLRRVAQTFAWGVLRGRELTGRLFRVHMIGGQELGYTRLRENRIFVTPMPILRGDRHARDVVEGLILHELGHHMYHRSPESLRIWGEAHREGLGGVLNLVADEQLERNLRARDSEYGDRLKRLAAYAFQHAAREVPVWDLFACLQGRSFEVLARTHLGVARHEERVSVESGALMHAMEHAGLAFPRFVRALRMGLGARHGDPQVDEALSLFRRAFRHSRMADMFAISRRLRDIFGWQIRLIESFGTNETIGDEDCTAEGEGITDHEVQKEVERVLDPRSRQRDGRSSREGGKGKPWINVNPAEDFDPITKIEKVPFDPVEHAKYAVRVRRASQQMKRYLERLGARLVPQRMRVSGRRLDPPRTKALVVRGDPRVLVARSIQIRTDLFLGVIIDCSGSMQGSRIERAKLFGTMLAEAAKGVPGVDVRIFGFTHKVIFDAGDAQHCAAHALEATDGNNDAAALWHVAQVARASARRAKLLVMISDGLPTECSVAALRGLVTKLGQRWGICCAQVAVAPIAEVCFPHYVLLEDEDGGVAVRKFGEVIARLVLRAMART